nr:MbnP family protein [uncultured Flavobacterium sp.]
MKNFKNITFALITLISLNSCSNDDDNTTPDVNGNTQINFDAKVGTADFALNTPFTIGGQSIQFEGLRYWISDVKLVNAKNENYSVANSYFLMEETTAVSVQEGAFTYPAKKREAIDLTAVPSGSYTKIIFSVGVDAAHNDNMSLQAGELSQLNGMTNVSWMWHTSYIFSSLTGKNVTPTTPVAISVETGLNANLRTVEITLPTALVVSNSKTAKLNLTVDVEKIVKDLDLVANPKVSASKAALMTQVADNYKNNVFTVKSVE